MPPPSTYRPDPDRLFGLIKVWDHGCETPDDCPHGRGSVTRFAEQLGRHRQSFWKFRDGVRLRRAFAVQIATALGVEVGDFTLADEEDGDAPAGPESAKAVA